MVKDINELEPQMQKLTDDDLKAKTAEFRQRLNDGIPLDELLVEAFAVVREVSSRVLRLRHFDAQLVSLSMPASLAMIKLTSQLGVNNRNQAFSGWVCLEQACIASMLKFQTRQVFVHNCLPLCQWDRLWLLYMSVIHMSVSSALCSAPFMQSCPTKFLADDVSL